MTGKTEPEGSPELREVRRLCADLRELHRIWEGHAAGSDGDAAARREAVARIEAAVVALEAEHAREMRRVWAEVERIRAMVPAPPAGGGGPDSGKSRARGPRE